MYEFVKTPFDEIVVVVVGTIITTFFLFFGRWVISLSRRGKIIVYKPRNIEIGFGLNRTDVRLAGTPKALNKNVVVKSVDFKIAKVECGELVDDPQFSFEWFAFLPLRRDLTAAPKEEIPLPELKISADSPYKYNILFRETSGKTRTPREFGSTFLSDILGKIDSENSRGLDTEWSLPVRVNKIFTKQCYFSITADAANHIGKEFLKQEKPGKVAEHIPHISERANQPEEYFYVYSDTPRCQL